jgi:Rrf2 family iron-sulfur cluster assembly transcriptional regulator
MFFPQTVEYALRAMAYMVVHADGERLTSQELSAATRIPVAYLSKILRKLVEADLLEGQRGHGGGFKLAKPPSKVRFADIFNAVDFELQADHCVFGAQACDPKKPCPLHGVWGDLKDPFIQWARKTTLLDVRRSATES